MKTEITHKLIGIAALILTASFISTAVQAATVTIDSLTYKTNENGTASVTDCLENFTGAVTIPSSITVDGTAYTITSIGPGAFEYCSSLTDVIIPEGVTSIGEGAFHNCTKLTEVIIPDSVTSIGSSAFQNCSSLTEIVIPESVTSIGNGAFYGCSSLTEIVIPESVTSIGEGAFDGCSSLTEVVIPESVTSIGDYAFYGCSSLTEIVIPESVTSIGVWAFCGCSSLTEIVIPEGVTSIGGGAFSSCYSLTEIVLPDSVTSIGDSAFQYCSSLKEIQVSENNSSYQSIEGILFSKDATLLYTYPAGKTNSSYTIPDSVTSIGSYAFDYCKSLTNVIIPDLVTSIGDSAFSRCTSLKEIQVSENNSSYQSIEGILFSKDGTLLHTYPTGKPDTSYIIPDSVISIGNYAFFYCTSLTEVIIPDSVTSIGSSAFEYCKSLTGIYFQSQTPPKVGYSVFYNCPENMIIYYPEGAEANWGTEWQGFVTAPWDPGVDPTPEQPSLTCGTVSKNPETGEISFTLTFTGTLQESADGITWSDVSDATEGSYSVTIQKNQNRFFRTIVH